MIENEVIIMISIVINNHSDSNIAAGTFILSYVRREDFYRSDVRSTVLLSREAMELKQ